MNVTGVIEEVKHENAMNSFNNKEFDKLFPFHAFVAEDGKVHYDEIKMCITNKSLDLIEYCMTHNNKNRKPKAKQIKLIINQIKNNKWIDDGNTITFDKNGMLIDGGHRINAFYQLIKEGFEFCCFVRFIKSPVCFNNNDNEDPIATRHSGRADTSTDFERMYLYNKGITGHGPCSMYGAISKLYAYFECGKMRPMKSTHLELQPFMNNANIDEAVRFLSDLETKPSYDTHSSVTGALTMLLYLINKKLAKDFAYYYYENKCTSNNYATIYHLTQKLDVIKKRKLYGNGGEIRFAHYVIQGMNALLKNNLSMKNFKKFENNEEIFDRLDDINGNFAQLRKQLADEKIITINKA